MTGYGGGRSQNDPATGWNEKGHKADCKLLKDADIILKAILDFPLNTTAV
jgi:hypothetical protein